MSTRKHRPYAVERLSDEGQEVVRRAHLGNWTLDETLRELREVTGERVSRSALSNWMQHERLKERFERAQAMADVIYEATQGAPGAASAQQWQLLLQEAALRKLDTLEHDLGEADAMTVLEQYRTQIKLALAERRTAVAERIGAAEEVKAAAAMKQADAAMISAQARLQALEQKAKEAARALEGAAERTASGRPLTAEELRQIREQVFGMVELAEGEHAA